VSTDWVVTAGDGGPSTEVESRPRRRRRGGGGQAGSGVPPLSRTWPSGCALDWAERERVSRAALQRYSQTTADQGTASCESLVGVQHSACLAHRLLRTLSFHCHQSLVQLFFHRC